MALTRGPRQSAVLCMSKRGQHLGPEERQVTTGIMDLLRRHVRQGGDVRLFVRELAATAGWLAHNLKP
jgi:hypothetical protein